mmetsp:Transcript_2349/g.4965  ORF Transcript_2349/g.4965 Transcript_2349/m.4965 type:complete len:371 (-) Transcript_2349:176-1288(-)
MAPNGQRLSVCAIMIGLLTTTAGASDTCIGASDDGDEVAAIQLVPGLRMAQAAHIHEHQTSLAPCPKEPADEEDRVHVIFSTNLNQVEGLLACTASAITATSVPVTFHIAVQEEPLPTFKRKLGMRQECQTMRGPKGSFIRFYLIDPSKVVVEPDGHRGRPDYAVVEMYARLHFHNFIGPITAIYLDVDTIVQGDLKLFWDAFVASGKTLAFVEYSGQQHPVRLHPEVCPLRFPPHTDVAALLREHEYNNGVYAVDLARWSARNISGLVEDFMAQQNACKEYAYDGGSQVPMNLAFLARPKDEEPDYIVVDSSWNFVHVGVKPFPRHILRRAGIIHWTGTRKPWLENGLAKDVWRAHRHAFDAMFLSGEA